MEAEWTVSPESRYDRHNLIDWWDQEKLGKARILVAGAGAIGNEALKLLALLGVGQLFVVDFDTVELSNLTRTVLFRAGDIGQGKAEIAAERVRQLNPDVEVRALQGDLQFDVGLGIYSAMDVVIGCLDSINARLALNRACGHVGVPWLNGGIEATLAQVTLYESGSGVCFECGMSPSMWDSRNRRYSCGGLRNETAENKMPTTAIVASLAASYLVNEALLLLHRAPGQPQEGLEFGQQISLTVKPYSFYIHTLRRHADCLAHDRWEPIEVFARSPQDVTVASLLQEMAMPDGIVELGFDLLTEMHCLQCHRREAIFRPIEKCSISLRHCADCGTESRQPETVSWLDATSPYADTPLAQLAVPEYQIVALKAGATRRYIQLTGQYQF